MTGGVIFGVIVVIWAVVLVPMWLRRHDETEETRSVDTFTKAMHTLSRREAGGKTKKLGLIPTRTSNHEVHVSGASADGDRPRVQRRRPTAASTASAAERRRRTFTGLLSLAVAALMLAVFMGGIAFWGLQVLLDIALLSFIAHLRNRARHAALIRPRRQTARVDEYDEYEDFDVEYADDHYEPAPVKVTPRPGRQTPRRQVAEREPVVEQDPVFDQDIAAEARYAPAALTASGGGAIFDQDLADWDRPAYSERGLAAPRETAEIVFDQADDYQPASAARTRQPRYDEQGRDLDVDIPFGEPERTRRPARSDIGSRPWEPVPVPKPVYSTKPAAPPRYTRAPEMEPVLPPLETAELNHQDDLEEILDRRWAVND